MIFKSALFTINLLLFCIQYEFPFANAMIGQNVRLVNEGEYTYVVSIKAIARKFQRHPERAHLCTGTLISPKDVITSASAFEEFERHEFEIIYGTNNIRSGISEFPDWWTTYSQWVEQYGLQNQRPVDDVAIIRMVSSVPETIQPIVILPLATNSLYGVNVEIVGWSQNINNFMNERLEAATLTVQSDEFCMNRMQEFTGIRSQTYQHLICSIAEPYLLTTTGLNGGPIIYMNTLVAIHKGLAPVLSSYNTRQLNYHITIESFVPFIIEQLNRQ